MTKPVIVRRTINASPATVFAFFTDRDSWLSWQGVRAEIDPRPDGVFRMTTRDGNELAGQFVTVEPHSRITFTWGWADRSGPVPAGSSTVDVTFESIGPDELGTLIRLSHADLPLELFAPQRESWQHYLDRLVVRAEGGYPGPDTWR